MKEIEIGTFAEFHNAIYSRFEYGCLFRGVPNAEFTLIPRVGRQLSVYESLGATASDLLSHEQLAFEMFCEEGASLFPAFAGSTIDRLVVAQHHGLPTRLLDWTFNPLVALFFATNADGAHPGAVYVLSQTKIAIGWLKDADLATPFECTGVHGYFPKHVSRRITGQRGLFTIHGEPTAPFDSEFITKLIVRADSKNDVSKVLKWYGVTDQALFPDLDGLARFVSGTAFLNLGVG